MVSHNVLVFQDDIAHPNNHPNRLWVDELSLVWHNDVQIFQISSHSLESFQIGYPKLCSAVEFEDLRTAFDPALVAEFGSRVVLELKVNISSGEFQLRSWTRSHT